MRTEHIERGERPTTEAFFPKILDTLNVPQITFLLKHYDPSFVSLLGIYVKYISRLTKTFNHDFQVTLKKNYTPSRGFRDHSVRYAQLLGGSLGQQTKICCFLSSHN